MLSDALSYPLDGDSWIRTVLIGGLLSLLTVFVVPIFFLQGYYVRVLRGVTNDDPNPPEFRDWGDLLVDGLKLFAVNLVVGLVAFLALGVVAVIFGAGSLLSAGGAGGDPGAAAGGAFAAFGVVGFLLFIAFALVLGYVAPGMFANFAREDSIAAAFDVSTIVAGVTTIEYLTAWVLAVVVGLVLGTIASLLSVVIVGVFVLFYVQVVTYYLFGRGFADGLDEKRGGSAATTY
ncbi:DUF4013 domain-containing protein [Halobellus rufus]|uniref:DUF4013 domain-containing protein n=1 Tax=Halobellus rufus TaxID=1448860 RepID=UPI000678CB40|nr:DUF4013 domain-containing protein [Halobellus rufus]